MTSRHALLRSLATGQDRVMTQDRAEIVRRCCAEGPSALAEVAADDFEQEEDGGIGTFLPRRMFFPELVVTVDEVFEAAGDRVIARLTVRADSRVDAPSWPAVHIFRFRGARVARVWSIHDLMERVGMRRELHAVRESLHRSGRWLDTVGYAILEDEWSPT